MKNNNNVRSIIFAVVAVVLILAGVFLLNRSFSSSPDPVEDTTFDEITTSRSSSSSEDFSSESSSESSFEDSSSSSQSSSLSSSLSSSSQGGSSSSSTSLDITLGTNEAVVEVVEVASAGGYNIKVIETSYSGGSLWASGKTFRVAPSTPLEVGARYKFVNVGESAGRVSYGVGEKL